MDGSAGAVTDEASIQNRSTHTRYAILLSTLTLMNLFNFVHCLTLDHPRSSLFQVIDNFHHMANCQTFVRKFVDTIISVVVECRCVAFEVVFTTAGFCKFCEEFGDARILDVFIIVAWGPMYLTILGKRTRWNVRRAFGEMWGVVWSIRRARGGVRMIGNWHVKGWIRCPPWEWVRWIGIWRAKG